MVRTATAVIVIMLTMMLVVSLLVQLTALYVVTDKLAMFSPSNVNKMMVKCFLPVWDQNELKYMCLQDANTTTPTLHCSLPRTYTMVCGLLVVAWWVVGLEVVWHNAAYVARMNVM